MHAAFISDPGLVARYDRMGRQVLRADDPRQIRRYCAYAKVATEPRHRAFLMNQFLLVRESLLMMPEMDGFEFMQELRKRPECHLVPVIVVTAKDITLEDRQRLNGQEARILQKNALRMEDLVAEVRAAAGHPHAALGAVRAEQAGDIENSAPSLGK